MRRSMLQIVRVMILVGITWQIPVNAQPTAMGQFSLEQLTNELQKLKSFEKSRPIADDERQNNKWGWEVLSKRAHSINLDPYLYNP